MRLLEDRTFKCGSKILKVNMNIYPGGLRVIEDGKNKSEE